jgi:hypothetical protein
MWGRKIPGGKSRRYERGLAPDVRSCHRLVSRKPVKVPPSRNNVRGKRYERWEGELKFSSTVCARIWYGIAYILASLGFARSSAVAKDKLLE